MFGSFLARRIWSRHGCLLLFLWSLALPFFGPGQGTTFSSPIADEVHWTFMSPTAVSFSWRGTATTISYGLARGTYTVSVSTSPPGILPFSSTGPFQEVKLTVGERDHGTEIAAVASPRLHKNNFS